jgi:hypothetical protein
MIYEKNNETVFIGIWQNVFVEIATNLDLYSKDIKKLVIDEIHIKVYNPVNISVYSQVRDLINTEITTV